MKKEMELNEQLNLKMNDLAAGIKGMYSDYLKCDAKT